jgi:hypothetical protein
MRLSAGHDISPTWNPQDNTSEECAAMRVLDRLLKPTVARLVAERIEEERLDALYRYRVHSDPTRLKIHPTAVVK